MARALRSNPFSKERSDEHRGNTERSGGVRLCLCCVQSSYTDLWDACKKAGYSFPFTDVKKWLDRQAMYQIFCPSPKHIPYASYSKITKPNIMHQCDLIKISYDEDVNTNLLDDSLIYYYVLLVIDCTTRYKDFIFLISKSSEEVAEAFKSI